MLGFGSLVELSKISEQAGVDEDADAAAKRLLGKVESIASMAKKSIMEYPVIVSYQLADSKDTVFKIVKTLELYYAQFTMMSAGLNPVVQGRSVGAHLGRFAGEDLKAFATENIGGIILKDVYDISDIKNSINIPVNVSSNGKMELGYNITKASAEDLQKMEFLWNELIKNETVYKFVESKAKQGLEARDITSMGNEPVNVDNEINNFGASQPVGYNTTGTGDHIDAAVPSKLVQDQFKTFLSSAHPTMVNITLYIGETNKSVCITLAVKAMPHFVGKEELDALFTAVFENQKKHFRWLQLKSGEISFFKDYILNMDRIAKDKKLYASLGRHPWYRRLLERKNKSIFQAILSILPVVKNFIIDKKTLPTCTLLVSATEMAYSNLSFHYMLKNGKHIKKIMDELMLLSLIVYDREAELIYFIFNGFTNPLIYRPEDLSSGKSSSTDSDYVKLMNQMLTKL